MNISIEVTGGTHRNTTCKLTVNKAMVGELQIERADFTKICDLLLKGNYIVTSKAPITTATPE